jgi:hypothetical protein
MRFHDLDRLDGTAITDVHPAGKDPERAGHQLCDLRIVPTAKGTTHCSP